MSRHFGSCLRWLGKVFQGQYFSSLSKNYVVINRDLEKLTPQHYWINMKICYDQGYNDSTVVMATNNKRIILKLLDHSSSSSQLGYEAEKKN